MGISQVECVGLYRYRRKVLASDDNQRSLVALLVAVFGIFIVYLTAPAVTIEPHGIFLPSAPLQTPVPKEQVQFYDRASLPVVYKPLGTINVLYHSKTTNFEAEQTLQQYVRQLASSAGANGVEVILFAHTLSGDVPSAQASYIFRGSAVYTVPNV